MSIVLNIVPVLVSTYLVVFGRTLSAVWMLAGNILLYAVITRLVMCRTTSGLSADVKTDWGADKIMQLLREFLRRWWGLIASSVLMTCVLPAVTDGKSMEGVALCLMSIVLLFGQFTAVRTEVVFTNLASYYKGSVGYVVTNLIEFVVYVFMSFVPFLQLQGVL